MQRTIRETFAVYKHVRGIIYSERTHTYSRRISHFWYTSTGESHGMLYSYAAIHRESKILDYEIIRHKTKKSLFVLPAMPLSRHGEQEKCSWAKVVMSQLLCTGWPGLPGPKRNTSFVFSSNLIVPFFCSKPLCSTQGESANTWTMSRFVFLHVCAPATA